MKRDSNKSSGLLALIGGAALGAVAMYLSDPDRGKRRRAVARDKMQSLMTQSRSAFDVASRDWSNRVQGMRAQANRMLMRRSEVVDNDILVARVRSKIGRAISHPHAIKVWADRGHVELSGPILPEEKKALVAAARSVHGVASVDDHTEVHEQADVPSLQGDGRIRTAPPRLRIMQDNWPPALRAAATVTGGALSVLGLFRRTPRSLALAAMGIGLVARGVSNTPLTRAAQRGTQTMDLHESIHIAASPEAVFDAWRNYENFPRFMSNVKEVRDLGDQHSHWVVSGPSDTQLEWDAVLTESDRGRMLAWKTLPGSMIHHTGVVQFQPEDDGTRVSVSMSYLPHSTRTGRTAMSVFNGDPTRQMAEDLIRMKDFVESGIPTMQDKTGAAEHTGKTLH
jgi:uncharacterized membrane protein/osmotically-inducible protein OsmY